MSLWNFTLDDTSTFLTYTPYADGSNSGLDKGWEPWYTDSGFITQNGEGGQGDSYHLTSLDGAAVTFEFYGTAVYLYGTTNSSYDTSLDNALYAHAAPDPTSDLLLSITDLKEAIHSVTLTARPTSNSQQLAFDRAVISTPLVDNQTPAELFYDNMDMTALKYTGDWSQSSADGIPNATVSHPWQETFAAGASVSMDIGAGAVGVSLWGMANWGNWLYTVSIDGGAENQYNCSTFWKVPDALLYYQGGLDPTKNHTVSLTNTTPKMKLALNSIRVYHIDASKIGNTTAAPSNSGTSSAPVSGPSSTGTPSAHSGVSAGVIAGPVIGALVILALVGGFFWWRFRRNRVRASTTQSMTQTDGYSDRAPHRPLFPPAGYSAATSMTALTHSPSFSAPVTQVSGPPGATVMTWGTAPYHDDDARSQTAMSSSAYSASPPSIYTSSSEGPRVPIGKMRNPTPPPPPPASTGLEAPDVDRLVELIAQRIDRRGHHDEASPPEYRG
ncbi:hypothetical protein B0H17DRAFT_687834 [Mycena rosella]|uniref:Transmembrane protein n=1 Tax=Mycena rosella TaxID=1033263 RepID=A0AAD7GG76_MYCRO|nr:hypothetical protein B0H17DRAFT_687834 [Mycena rosella]